VNVAASVAARLARLDDASLEDVEERAAALAHDVGKYVVRVARNVRDGEPVPVALVGMLARDLYETHRGERASARFDALAAGLPEPLRAADELESARALLAEIDVLEPRVRAADPEALAEALAAARALEATLSALARMVRAERAERAAAGPACVPGRGRG
jgi:hypothetical protein